ncbi:interferon-induced protein 44-like [Mercenaria mercenaria]|uniref:interferon-induced protein 44-like n=1 Tax=Mercenaria mercenaria TaxID=6596 RepID=UPI00234F5BBA|nr:interferon-induced protein 44-like [Mercenaria mercenaria]
MEGAVSYINPWAWYRWARPHPILDKPWRREGDPEQINEQLAEKLRKDITDIKFNRGMKKANVIVLGPAGAGKSSFINSLLSCMKGRLSKKTTTSVSDGDSFTTKMLKLTAKDLNIRLFDTMGINVKKFISEEEIKSILEGKLKHGYSFRKKDTTESEPNTDYTNVEPKENEKIQVAVIVVAADAMKDIPSDENKMSAIREKVKEISEVLKEYDILPIYILTNVDAICAEVRRSPKMIFQSRAVHEMVKKVHDTFGPDENDIFPVVNYVKEVDTTTVRDIPLLFALRHIVRLAADHAENDSI